MRGLLFSLSRIARSFLSACGCLISKGTALAGREHIAEGLCHEEAARLFPECYSEREGRTTGAWNKDNMPSTQWCSGLRNREPVGTCPKRREETGKLLPGACIPPHAFEKGRKDDDDRSSTGAATKLDADTTGNPTIETCHCAGRREANVA